MVSGGSIVGVLRDILGPIATRRNRFKWHGSLFFFTVLTASILEMDDSYIRLLAALGKGMGGGRSVLQFALEVAY